jgi:hypothetical protein
MTNKINHLKEQGLTELYVATHWLAHRVLPLKKQVHPGWEYIGLLDLTWESREKITLELLVKHLEEIFQYTSRWPTDDQVRYYHIGVERDPVRRPCLYQYYCLLEILHFVV